MSVLLSVHNWPTVQSQGPGLCGWVFCTCLNPLLGPDSLTLPSLLAHRLALHSLSFCWIKFGEEIGGWGSPYQ